MSMNMLAIDTSGARCSVALSVGTDSQCLRSDADRRHASELLPMIQALLHGTGLSLAELHAIAVVVGPGSFTGLRIGTAVAQGLAFGVSLPVIAVSALQVLAQQHLQSCGSVVAAIRVCLRAREHEYYVASFDCRSGQAQQIGAASVATAETALPAPHLQLSPSHWCGVGDGWQDESLLAMAREHGLRVTDDAPVFDAVDVFLVATQQYACGDVLAAEALQPMYLKDELEYRRLDH